MGLSLTAKRAHGTSRYRHNQTVDIAVEECRGEKGKAESKRENKKRRRKKIRQLVSIGFLVV